MSGWEAHQALATSGVLLLRQMLTARECDQLRRLDPVPTNHGGDDGHGDGGHHHHPKPHRVTWLAARLARDVEQHTRGGLVDPLVKVYRLEMGQGVGLHRDMDFATPAGWVARWSVLAYLSEGHEGGDTVFPSMEWMPHPGLGDVLVFRHALEHLGTPVTKGTRYVLKTDVLVRP